MVLSHELHLLYEGGDGTNQDALWGKKRQACYGRFSNGKSWVLPFMWMVPTS